LDDRTVSRMYWSQVIQRVNKWGGQLWEQVVLRSGVVTIGVLVLLVLSLAIGWRAHTRGRFARLKAEFREKDARHEVEIPRPGGQEAFTLERSPIDEGSAPEFLSATLLPGRGLNVLQITAMLPHKGVVSLLDSPSVEEAAKVMDGTGVDANGGASLAFGAAIEAPWSGNLFGSPGDKVLTTRWNGTEIRVPAERRGEEAVATGGLLLNRQGTAAKTHVMPDGGEGEAVYDAGDFDGMWPSKMRIKSVVQLSGRSLDMKIVATNTGGQPQPVGIGWRPRFALLSKDRSNIRLRLPSVTKEEIRDRRSGLPTGRLISVEESKEDFSAITGKELGDEGLDDTFVHLRQAPLDSGPVMELWDSENNFGLRITMLSASIKAIHVSAPADGKSIVLEPRFNYDDPFGTEWSKDEKSGMTILQPGDSVQWQIRLEIYGPAKPSPSM
jgi:aldose 1-epimerase